MPPWGGTLSKEGARPFVFGPDVVTVTGREPVYVRCVCGEMIREPFVAHESVVSIAWTHQRSAHRPCRMILTIHPDGATEATEVPDGITLEDALLAHRRAA